MALHGLRTPRIRFTQDVNGGLRKSCANRIPREIRHGEKWFHNSFPFNGLIHYFSDITGPFRRFEENRRHESCPAKCIQQHRITTASTATMVVVEKNQPSSLIDTTAFGFVLS